MMRNYARDKTIKNLFKKFNMPRHILQYFVIITINFHMILWGDGRGGWQRGGGLQKRQYRIQTKEGGCKLDKS